MGFVRLVDCSSYMNPVIEVGLDGGRAYYGVPLRAEGAVAVIAPAANTSVLEAVRRLEPPGLRVYAAAGTVIARVAAALGHRVVEVSDEERVDGARLVRGSCGLYMVVGSTLLAPPCDASTLYSELHRLDTEGVRRVVASACGAGVDAYLHRASVVLGKTIYLVECASGWLGEAGTVLEVPVLRVGEHLEA